MALVLNELETKRFGVKCARFAITSNQLPDLALLNEQARVEGIRMVSARLDVSHLPLAHLLEDDGYRLMDSLVYYTRPNIPLPETKLLPDGLSLRRAIPEDALGVAIVAREAFKGYFGHYHVDPRLDNAAADDAYVEWAETSVSRMDNGKVALIVEAADKIVGFCTVKRLNDMDADIELSGIMPENQGGGLYSRLIEHCILLSQEMGAENTKISTQINNYAVQKVWARSGFHHERSVYTFHKWFD